MKFRKIDTGRSKEIKEEYEADIELSPLGIKGSRKFQSIIVAITKYADGENRLEVYHELDGSQTLITDAQIQDITFEAIKPAQYRDAIYVKRLLG